MHIVPQLKKILHKYTENKEIILFHCIQECRYIPHTIIYIYKIIPTFSLVLRSRKTFIAEDHHHISPGTLSYRARAD